MFCVANKKVLWTFLNDERPKRKRRADRRGNPENISDAKMDCHVAFVIRKASQALFVLASQEPFLTAPRNDGLEKLLPRRVKTPINPP